MFIYKHQTPRPLRTINLPSPLLIQYTDTTIYVIIGVYIQRVLKWFDKELHGTIILLLYNASVNKNSPLPNTATRTAEELAMETNELSTIVQEIINRMNLSEPLGAIYSKFNEPKIFSCSFILHVGVPYRTPDFHTTSRLSYCAFDFHTAFLWIRKEQIDGEKSQQESPSVV